MLFKNVFSHLDKHQAFDLWQRRLESVDNAINNSTTAWSLEFWQKVRRSLVRQANLLNAGYKEN